MNEIARSNETKKQKKHIGIAQNAPIRHISVLFHASVLGIGCLEDSFFVLLYTRALHG